MISLAASTLPFSASAQGTFQNLDFESANLSPVPPNQNIVEVSTASALPGWTTYLGTVQQTQVIQNSYGEGEAEIDVFGPNYPAAGPSHGLIPGTIDGNYSVLLQSGGEPGNSIVPIGASITQTGVVPSGAQSMQFKAWQTYFTAFTVSFNGTALSPVVLAAGPNYTLYGVNISPYDGQSGPLEFTADFSGTGASWLGLDDIVFSPAAVPEPSPILLTGVGGLMLGVYRRFRQRHQANPTGYAD